LETFTFIVSELQKPIDLQQVDRIKSLSLNLSTSSSNDNDNKQKIYDILSVDVNKDTTDMIDDIVKSFEDILTKPNANPLNSVMEISKSISLKYADKINKGDIELNKLMGSIMKKVPGMEKMMGNMGDINKMMEGVMGSGKTEKKEKVIIDENYSTAVVKVPELKDDSSNLKLGNVLKMADQFGVIPGGKTDPKSNGLGSILSSLGNSGGGFDELLKGLSKENGGSGEIDPGVSSQLNKMVGMLNKLQNVNTKEEASEMKAEMDTFLEKDLGINVKDLSNVMNNISSN